MLAITPMNISPAAAPMTKWSRTGWKKLRGELKKDIVYKDGIQYPREPKDLPKFLPRLCEKYGGPERSRRRLHLEFRPP